MAEWANNIFNAYPYFSRSSGQNGSTANRIPTTTPKKKIEEQNLEAFGFQNCQLSSAKYFLLSFFAEYFFRELKQRQLVHILQRSFATNIYQFISFSLFHHYPSDFQH